MTSKRIIHQARVTQIDIHTDQIKEFHFENIEPQSFQYKAGQFLMIHITNANGGKDILRAYSLASGHHDQRHFRLLIKYIPQGVASQYFWQLRKDDTVRFTGPFGKLFFPTTPAKNLFFLSTGSGLAPHLSYVESYLDTLPDHHFEFLIGVRTQNDFFFETYLRNLKEKHANFRYQFVLSRPDETWKGRCGYLQHQIADLKPSPSDSQFFICGNEDMAKSTKQCLIDTGFAPEDIFVEIF